MNKCECGCNQECKNRFVSGHNFKVSKETFKPHLCECGCGIKTKKKYIYGHHLCICGCGEFSISNLKHSHVTDIMRKQKSELLSGLKRTEEQKKHYRYPKSKEHSKNISKSLLGKKKTKEHQYNISLALKDNLNMKHTEEWKQQHSIDMMGKNTAKGRKNTLEQTIKHSEIMKKAYIDHPEMYEKVFKNSGKKRFSYISSSGEIIKMRSSWEIKYAEYLTENNILWQYEPKQFKLSSGKRYWPDFYLPQLNEYNEIKGFTSNVAKEKLELFYNEYPEINHKMLYKEDLLSLGISLSNI